MSQAYNLYLFMESKIIFPWDNADRLYKSGYRIEAFQTLHNLIEFKLQEIFMLVGSVHFNADLSDTWDLTDELPYLSCTKALYILNHISKNEYQTLMKINRTRNLIMHYIFDEPYKKGRCKMSDKELDSDFKSAKTMAELLEIKSHEESSCPLLKHSK